MTHNLSGYLSSFDGDRKVLLDGKLLTEGRSQAVYNHSPDGFNWGYGGSGPSQLALAVMLELYGEEKALAVYQDFKSKVIVNLPQGKDFDINF